MDFSISDGDRELYEAALKFGTALPVGGLGTISDQAARRDAFRACWAACGAHGLTGASASTSCGGAGLGALSTALVIEAFARGCPDSGLAFALCAHLFACLMPVSEFGTPEQKSRFGVPMAEGRAIGANAITESDAGSDVFALKTRATKRDGGYVLDGVKSYVSNGPLADTFLVYAITNPKWGYMGMSAFLVDRGRRGLTVGQPMSKIGLESSQTSQIYLDDCFVESPHLLGAEGQGAEVFRWSMIWERACLFALYLGCMERQLASCIAYANDRKQFGRPIGKNQAVANRIVEMKLRLEAARLLLHRGCWKLDRGEDCELEISLSKLAVSDGAIQSGIDAIQIFGGVGCVRETGIEVMLRDAIPSTVFSGTTEVQKNIIAGILGL